MRLGWIIAAALAGLLIAHGAAAQGATTGVEPPLDQFTAQYGYPTFPIAPEYDVPYIWNGPDYDVLRIGDLTKIPVIDQAAPATPAPKGQGPSGFSHPPGFR